MYRNKYSMLQKCMEIKKFYTFYFFLEEGFQFNIKSYLLCHAQNNRQL